jgi:hypothetical protein
MKDAYDRNLDILEDNGIEHIDGNFNDLDEIGRLKVEKVHMSTAYGKCLYKLYNLGKKNLNDVECDDIASIITEACKNNWIEIEDTAKHLLHARNNYYEYYCNLGTDLCLDMSNYDSRAYLRQYVSYLDDILINCNDFINAYSIDNETDAKEEYKRYITDKLMFLIDVLNNIT